MNKRLVFFSFIVVTQVYNLCAWSTDYRVINTINKEIQVRLTSVGRDVGNFKLKPGQVKTVTTNLANCIDLVFVDGTYRGGAVCAGSVVCITDEGGIPHVLAKPYYGQQSKDLPCTGETVGKAFGAGGGAGGAVVATDVGLGAAQAAVETSALLGSAATGAIAGAAGASALATLPITGIVGGALAAGALVGCGAADLAAMSGFAKGSAGTFSAEDWQDPESTIESRAEKKRKSEEQARLAQVGTKAMQDQDAKREKARQAALAAFQKG